MYLTEEQIQSREESFLELVEAVAEEFYDMNEEYTMSEEDAYVTSLLMDYFVENFKQPTMRDAVMESYTGVGVNDALYEEIMEMMLDESIGSFVAGAAHGIRNLLSKGGKKMAQRRANTAGKRASSLKAKSSAAAKAAKGKTGIRATFHQAKSAAVKSRADTASTAHSVAKTDRDAASAKHATNVRKTGELAKKIDTGISNIGTKIKSGAHKVVGAAGRLAGRFA